jgi:hypothetical protein
MNTRLVLLLTTLAAPLAAQTTALLENYSLDGQHRDVEWTNLGNTNAGLAFNASLSDAAGSLAVNSPGFRSSVGFYSFAGPYSFTTGTSSAPFDIGTVLLQYVGGHNPDFDSQYLTFNGGPVLTYTLADQSTGTLPVSHAVQATGPVNLTVGAFTADFHGHAWEWDLTSVVGVITAISIQVPVPVHTSLTNLRLQFGDTYSALLAPVPEPSAFAALAGLGALALAATRRRRIR